MSLISALPRRRRRVERVDHQLHATCETTVCPRRGLDILPWLETCPGCGQPLVTRQVRS